MVLGYAIHVLEAIARGHRTPRPARDELHLQRPSPQEQAKEFERKFRHIRRGERVKRREREAKEGNQRGDSVRETMFPPIGEERCNAWIGILERTCCSPSKRHPARALRHHPEVASIGVTGHTLDPREGFAIPCIRSRVLTGDCIHGGRYRLLPRNTPGRLQPASPRSRRFHPPPCWPRTRLPPP